MLVLPVLVAGARMPKPEQLPEDMRALTSKNALPLRHESFDDDTENILAAVLGRSTKERAWDERNTSKATLIYGAGGAILAAMLLLATALLHFWILGRPLSASIGAPLTTLLLIGGSILGVWIGLDYAGRRRKRL